MNLPPELVELGLVKVRELGSGAEADVLLVVDGGGAEWAVKLYRPGLSFDGKASSLLERALPAHVVKIERPGYSEAFHQWFEVLEYCPLQSMREVLNSGHSFAVADVVAELSAALEHIHSLRLESEPDARLVHQDLKPDTVLVRSLEPLDLVLDDFGLARMIAGSVHLTSRQQGFRLGAPPPGEAPSIGWDWWSLGMLVAELAAGVHPFFVGGQWMSPEAINDTLSRGPVDLSAVADERVQTLCRGLLTRRVTDRWGAEQVKRWLAGGLGVG